MGRGTTHMYVLMDQEVLCGGWTGEDELKLLCSLEENGYGNWLVHCTLCIVKAGSNDPTFVSGSM